MSDKVEGLIDVLIDNTARPDERDDAAMDLGRFNDDRALNALLRVGSNPNEDEMILDSCGDSIGEILVKKGKYDPTFINNLAPVARSALYSFIKEARPEWLK